MKRHGSMNHVYRLVWSHAANGWVPVAETMRGRSKGSRRTLTLAASVVTLTASLAQAAPTGGHVVTGAGTITQSGATTTINQATQNLSLNWLSFNIAPQETVNFLQPSATSIAVNRILGGSGTQILGHLNANGQVFLINPNGILFGRGAQVNVGGLVASTLDFNDANLPGSEKYFTGSGAGAVTNQGTLTAAESGYVALLGNHVSNRGTITAQLGTVALGAGSAATLTFSGNKLLRIQVDRNALNSAANNGGLIQADGGQVVMTAGAKNSLVASAVNNTGVIEARTVDSRDGTITLLGGMTAGTVNVAGTLDASAPSSGNGGYVETSAADVNIASGTRVTTAAAMGLAGTWLIDPSDFTVAASGGNESGAALSSALGAGNVTLMSSAGTAGGSGNVNVNDTVTWSANNILTLTASNNVNVNGVITANGATAGIAINPNTANGAEAASGTGTYSLGTGGVINLPNVSPNSTVALKFNGTVYRVINSLGAANSTTQTDLQGINGSLSSNYALGSNINASATSSWNGGQGFTPLGGGPSGSQFSGVFDGLGHTISGLTMVDSSRSDFEGLGLFGNVSTVGVIRNVGLTGANVSGNYGTGALVGWNYGTVTNSHSTGTVSARWWPTPRARA